MQNFIRLCYPDFWRSGFVCYYFVDAFNIPHNYHIFHHFHVLERRRATEQIEGLEKLEGQDINEAKKTLADAATAMLHGLDAAKAANETAQKTFEQGQLGQDLPTFDVPRADLSAGIAAFNALILVGFGQSGGEAKRLIKGGGARINDVSITDINHTITDADLNADGVIKVSAGKKRHALLRAV